MQYNMTYCRLFSSTRLPCHVFSSFEGQHYMEIILNSIWRLTVYECKRGGFAKVRVEPTVPEINFLLSSINYDCVKKNAFQSMYTCWDHIKCQLMTWCSATRKRITKKRIMRNVQEVLSKLTVLDIWSFFYIIFNYNEEVLIKMFRFSDTWQTHFTFLSLTTQGPFTLALYIPGPWCDSLGVLHILYWCVSQYTNTVCALQRYWELWHTILTAPHIFMYLSCYKAITVMCNKNVSPH